MSTFEIRSEFGEVVCFDLATYDEAESELEGWEAFRPDVKFRIVEVAVNPDTIMERVYDALRAAGRKDLADELADWFETLEV